MVNRSSNNPDDRDREAAAMIVESRVRRDLLDELPTRIRPVDIDDAYRVQSLAHRLLTAADFGEIGGWKIGCTTRVMQEFLGVDTPVAGAMFLGSMGQGHREFLVSSPCVLGVECEIAVRMSRDLDRSEQPYDVHDVAGSIASSMAAIEVVEDRFVDYASLGLATLAADDFFHFGSVVGEEHDAINPYELKDVTATLSINGEFVESGRGSDILGDPLNALVWLANHLVGRGLALRAGDVVSLGSVVKTQWVQPGDAVAVDNDALGHVSASFGGS